MPMPCHATKYALLCLLRGSPSPCSSHSAARVSAGVLPSSNQTSQHSLAHAHLPAPPAPRPQSSPSRHLHHRLSLFCFTFTSCGKVGDPNREEASHSPSRLHTRFNRKAKLSLRKLLNRQAPLSLNRSPTCPLPPRKRVVASSFLLQFYPDIVA